MTQQLNINNSTTQSTTQQFVKLTYYDFMGERDNHWKHLHMLDSAYLTEEQLTSKCRYTVECHCVESGKHPDDCKKTLILELSNDVGMVEVEDVNGRMNFKMTEECIQDSKFPTDALPMIYDKDCINNCKYSMSVYMVIRKKLVCITNIEVFCV